MAESKNPSPTHWTTEIPGGGDPEIQVLTICLAALLEVETRAGRERILAWLGSRFAREPERVEGSP